MEKRRVVVTGVGAVTPLGNDVETTWKNIIEGKSGIGPLTRVNADEYPAKVSASRIVAMSFCEPRSCRLQLSS